MEISTIKNIIKTFKYKEHNKELMPDNLQEFKKLANSFNYDRSVGQSLNEETFDDFDTVTHALKTGLELELKNFVISLLADNVEKFAWAFVAPSSETFKEAWGHVVTKFTLRDERSRDQFLNRMNLIFRSIFLDELNIGDEATALEIADKYFALFNIAIHELLDEMKKNQSGVSIDVAQDYKKEYSHGEIDFR